MQDLDAEIALFFEKLFIQIPLYRLFFGAGEGGIGYLDVVELAI